MSPTTYDPTPRQRHLGGHHRPTRDMSPTTSSPDNATSVATIDQPET